MFSKVLNENEIKFVYNNFMIHDFPKDELKPLSSILKMYTEKIYLCFGFFSEQDKTNSMDSIKGYAFFTIPKNNNTAHLDYYAVLSSVRNSGYGSKFITLLKEEMKNFDAIINEVEQPEKSVDFEEKILRERRIKFYIKNGFKTTLIKSNLFGVDYNIMYFPIKKTFTDSEIHDALSSIYFSMFGEKTKTNKIQIYK